MQMAENVDLYSKLTKLLNAEEGGRWKQKELELQLL